MMTISSSAIFNFTSYRIYKRDKSAPFISIALNIFQNFASLFLIGAIFTLLIQTSNIEVSPVQTMEAMLSSDRQMRLI